MRAVDALLVVAAPGVQSSRLVKQHLQLAALYKRPTLYLQTSSEVIVQMPSVKCITRYPKFGLIHVFEPGIQVLLQRLSRTLQLRFLHQLTPHLLQLFTCLRTSLCKARLKFSVREFNLRDPYFSILTPLDENPPRS